MVVFDDPGPKPSQGDLLFTGRSKNGFSNSPAAEISAGARSCGAKEVLIFDGDVTHIWSVVASRPPDIDAYVDCVARHAFPMVFRVRFVTLSNGS